MKVWEELLTKVSKKGEEGTDSSLVAHLLKGTDSGTPNSISKEELNANLTLFFLAGHETSAVSLASVIWSLARYPDVQEKVYREIASVCGPSEPPTYDTQKELHYLTQVMYEANRLTPPAGSITRVTTEDTNLLGVPLQKGTRVVVQIDGAHMLEKEWPNPTEFNPERFSSSEVSRHPFAWQTFGMGVRACLGRNFSVLEQRIALVRMLQLFRFSLLPGAPTHIETNDQFGLVRVLNTVNVHNRN